tara:strand:+ start:428 stop:610 length:183 start_codon:yes stop_codon:yes gene_type:complete
MVEKKTMTENQLKIINDLVKSNGINDWEKKFLNNLLKYKTISFKQYQITRKIYSNFRVLA